MFPFFFLFLLMGGVFAAIFSLAAQARRQAARAAKTDPEATATPPVRTAPSAAPQKPVSPAAPRPTVTPRVQTEERTAQPAGIYRETYAKKPAEQPPKPAPKPHEPSPAAKAQPATQPAALSFTGSDALRGVLYAEILGKPKALQ